MAHVMITSRWPRHIGWRHRWWRMRGDDVSMFIRTEKRKNNKNAQRLTSWLRHDDVIITLGRCKFWVLSVRRVWPSRPSRSQTPSSDPICRRSRWKEELEEEKFPRICFFLRKFSPNTFSEFFKFFAPFFCSSSLRRKNFHERKSFSKIILFCCFFFLETFWWAVASHRSLSYTIETSRGKSAENPNQHQI